MYYTTINLKEEQKALFIYFEHNNLHDRFMCTDT